jgi:hypothetical protein
MGYKRTQKKWPSRVVKEWSVGFRDAGLPGHELESRGINLSRVLGIDSCRIRARNELDCAKKAV